VRWVEPYNANKDLSCLWPLFKSSHKNHVVPKLYTKKLTRIVNSKSHKLKKTKWILTHAKPMCHSSKLNTQKWQESFVSNLTYEKKEKQLHTLPHTWKHNIQYQIPITTNFSGCWSLICCYYVMLCVNCLSHLSPFVSTKNKTKTPILGTLHTILMSKLKEERSVKLWIQKHSFKSYCLLEEHFTCITSKS
jgi:hypothetical protein